MSHDYSSRTVNYIQFNLASYFFHVSFQVYVEIKDDVVNFFHDQGITIVTIQPEFQLKSRDKNESNLSLNQCLIGCQSVECAPKTCCSTNDLDTIITGDAPSKQLEYKKSKYSDKSNSLMSLNVPSLTKFRKMTGSTPDIIKKSVSESQVGPVGAELCESTTPNVSQVQSTDNIENGSHENDTKKEIITEDAQSKKHDDKCERNIVKEVEEQNLLAEIQPKLRVIVTRNECDIEEVSLNTQHAE